MRRLPTILLATALGASLLAFAPATDGAESGVDEGAGAEQDTTDLPDPVDVTMYFHGDDEVDVVDDNTTSPTGSALLMDRTAPTDNSYETKQLVNYVQGPNARCAGNSLLPIWSGFVGNGTLTGFGTVTFRSLGSVGGDVIVEVFTDVSGQACNEAYPEPAASTQVTLPAGEGEVTAVLDLDGVDPTSSLMVQLRPADSPTKTANPVPDPGAPTWPAFITPHHPLSQTRVVYDGTSFLSNISFTCQPDEVTFDEEGQPSHTPDCLPF